MKLTHPDLLNAAVRLLSAIFITSVQLLEQRWRFLFLFQIQDNNYMRLGEGEYIHQFNMHRMIVESLRNSKDKSLI